ncbi:MAG: hypothetical protein MHM6MM_006188 [Cercozoa sp. M6MM]
MSEQWRAEINDSAIQAQEDALKAAIVASSKLVEDAQPLSKLEGDFAGNVTFLRKLSEAQTKYTQYRAVRRDGNCFYRACMFALYESNLQRGTMTQWRQQLHESKDLVLAAGLPDIGIEMFWEEAVELCDRLISAPQEKAAEVLLENFREQGTSDCVVQYARFLASAFLRLNCDEFQAYVSDGLPIDVFCQTQIEVPNREADHLMCIALARILRVPLLVEYVDNSAGGLNNHRIEVDEAAHNPVTLLYRPGHFDVLY